MNTSQFAQIDIGSLDVVLLSNPERALALPLLARSPEFHARVLATEPTLHFAR